MGLGRCSHRFRWHACKVPGGPDLDALGVHNPHQIRVEGTGVRVTSAPLRGSRLYPAGRSRAARFPCCMGNGGAPGAEHAEQLPRLPGVAVVVGPRQDGGLRLNPARAARVDHDHLDAGVDEALVKWAVEAPGGLEHDPPRALLADPVAQPLSAPRITLPQSLSRHHRPEKGGSP